MDVTNLKTRIKNDLLWLGQFTSEAGSDRLDSAILASALKIWIYKPWSWKYVTSSITTTSGTTGPYSPPSDFYNFAIKQKAHKFLVGELQMIYPVKETDTNEFDIYYDEIEDKIYFAQDPGSGSITLAYQADFDNDIDNISATLTKFPEELFNAFEKFVPAHLLDNPDNKKVSQNLEAEGYAILRDIYSDSRRGKRRAKGTSARGFNGCVYDGIANAETLEPVHSRIYR